VLHDVFRVVVGDPVTVTGPLMIDKGAAGAMARHRCCPLAVGLARQAAQMDPVPFSACTTPPPDCL
jgi:hypothetical protein